VLNLNLIDVVHPRRLKLDKINFENHSQLKLSKAIRVVIN